MKPIERVHQGKFNNMHQEWQPDGSVIITISDRKEKKAWELKVKDLYKKKEKVEWEHEKPPPEPEE